MYRKVLVCDPDTEIWRELPVVPASKDDLAGWLVTVAEDQEVFIYKKGRGWEAAETDIRLKPELVQLIGDEIDANEDWR